MSGNPVSSAIKTVAKRHEKDGITPALVKEIMGLPADTPDTAKVNNEEWDKKYQAYKEEQATTSVDPAIAAYEAWENTTITAMAPKAFDVVVTRPHRDNPKVQMILFHPAVGERRWITKGAAALRAKHGTYSFYLLSLELENEGLVLISKLSGCPKPDAKCSICKKPLFANERAWKDYLREDVLEKIIMDQVKINRIKWRKSHVGCRKFQDWQQNFQAAELSLGSQQALKKVGHKEAVAAGTQLNEQWAKKGHGLIGWLRGNGYITREESDRLRASVNKITNTTDTHQKGN